MRPQKNVIRSLFISLVLAFCIYAICVIDNSEENWQDFSPAIYTGSSTSQSNVKTYFNQTISPPGILVNPIGGIGNQLFCYACSYSLAREKNLPLYVFVQNYSELAKSNDTRNQLPHQREFALDQFQIPQLNLYNPESTVPNVNYVSEDKYLDRELPDIKNEGFIQLNGYCQSPEYFVTHADELKGVLQPSENVANSFTDEVKSVQNNIQNTESVALHIRRGDFLHAGGNAFFMPISYQRTAIRRMLKILKEKNSPPPVFFVFSDDIEYVKGKFSDFEENYKFVYVSNLNTTSIQDLYLMIKCKHIIIPNSTFSWWAAFLNPNENKVVIASANNPEFWKLGGEGQGRDWYKRSHGRIYHPSSWIVIDPFSGEQ